MMKDKLIYTEEAALIFEKLGMTRMAGRVFGTLVVSEKESLSFDEIRLTLDASKGSISSTTRQLTQIGLIEPLSLPGDRKTYYRVTKIELGEMLKSRMQMFAKFSKILKKGCSMRKQEDEISNWLLEASTFYSWVGGEMDQVIDKWHQQKDEIINRHQQKNGKEKDE